MKILLESGEMFDTDDRPLWITRDSRFGALVEDVDVWRSRPIRVGGAKAECVVWVPADGAGCASFRGLESLHAASIPLEKAREFFATLPETDRECVWLAGDLQTRPELLT